jgi:hypothetical protein
MLHPDFWPLLGELLAVGLATALVLAAMRWALGVHDAHRRELAEIEAERAIEVARWQASHPLPPHTHSPSVSLTYAPHTRTHNEAGELLPGDTAQAGEAELPGALDLSGIAHTPTKDAILLGLAPGGERITVPASRLVHVALAGATGSGKTNTSRLLLAQLLASGVRCLVANPHYTSYDAASNEDWRPITSRLHLAPARTAQDIRALLHWLAVEELNERLKRREAEQIPGKPLVLFLDELPVIVNEVEGAIELLSKLLRQGRALGLYVAGASQDFLVKTLGGGSGIRDAYRTACYSGGDVVSASALLDMSRRDINAVEGELGGGRVLLRSHATTPARLVRVPYVSNEALYKLLPDDLHQQAPAMPRVYPADGSGQQRDTVQCETVQPTDGIQCETVQQATPAETAPEVGSASAAHEAAYVAPARNKPASVEAERALALFLAGKSTTQITEELRGVNSRQGSKYRQAADEVHELIRTALAARGLSPALAEREASA